VQREERINERWQSKNSARCHGISKEKEKANRIEQGWSGFTPLLMMLEFS
jgi:hypothetical protein